jgi:hypothetical protein
MRDRAVKVRPALLGALAALCVLSFAGSARAAEEEHVEHVFDAGLSLRGNCSIFAEDPIPDPGLCPMPPGVPGVDHPPKPFKNPCGTVTDSYGDIYVASSSPGNGSAGTEGRIDIFNAAGEYLTEIKDAYQPCDLAVDSEGNLYVLERSSRSIEKDSPYLRVMLFAPSSYPPQVGAVYPTEAEATVIYQSEEWPEAIAVDPPTIIFTSASYSMASWSTAPPPKTHRAGNGPRSGRESAKA